MPVDFDERWPQYRHKRVGEDGKMVEHMGYESRQCINCGIPYWLGCRAPIGGTGEVWLTCGRKDCDKQEVTRMFRDGEHLVG